MKYLSPIIITCFVGGISLCIGFYAGKYFSPIPSISEWEIIDSPIEEHGVRQHGEYVYTNPLLECENNSTFAKQKYIPFENTILSRIEKEIEVPNPDLHLSVYFRNLNNGPWFGIRENEGFAPASLMKISILISYLKMSESDPTLLGRVVPVTNGMDGLKQTFEPESWAKIGSGYTIEDLLRYMIIYSDNTATNTLLEHLPNTVQAKTLQELGIPLPDGKSMEYLVTVKEYASFFRVLYNSSYLSREKSELALKILSESTFNNGITKLIPEAIPVAHKFWERESLDGSGNVIQQLHDCGIVYHTNYPYLICVMSRWTVAMSTLEKALQDTSGIIYSEINTRYGDIK